jgi:hypothetical protein
MLQVAWQDWGRDLRFTQPIATAMHFGAARRPYQPTPRLRAGQALRLSPPCPRTAGEQQGNFAQHKSRRHHPGCWVQYTG